MVCRGLMVDACLDLLWKAREFLPLPCISEGHRFSPAFPISPEGGCQLQHMVKHMMYSSAPGEILNWIHPCFGGLLSKLQ